VPDKNKVIGAFQTLSREIGPERTLWRYDPILLTTQMDTDYHLKSFASLAERLEGYTRQCTISFMDMYKKIERNMRDINYLPMHHDTILKMAEQLSIISRRHGIIIKTCSEQIDLSGMGIEHASCIDGQLISDIIGKPLEAKKDKNQREACGCAESIDIGAYNSCGHGCLYCYANYSDNAVINNQRAHDPQSALLIGNLEPEDKVKKREMVSQVSSQMRMI